MREYMKKRCTEIANYVVTNGVTIREAAEVFGVSKSTVHKDLTERLSEVDEELAIKAKSILSFNKSERHMRGGLATKAKYKG